MERKRFKWKPQSFRIGVANWPGRESQITVLQVNLIKEDGEGLWWSWEIDGDTSRSFGTPLDVSREEVVILTMKTYMVWLETLDFVEGE